jgi:hypothetical protein
MIIRPIESGDIEHIAAHLAQGDRDEWCAFRPALSASEAIGEAVLNSTEHWAAAIDGEPCAIFGVVPHAQGPGCPWIAGTDAARAEPGAFAEAAGNIVRRWCAQYGRLVGFVDARNTRGVELLWTLRFTIREATPLAAVEGLLFHQFEMGARAV